MKKEYRPIQQPEILTLLQSYELEYRSTAADGSFYFDCPFCKGKGKLNVNTDNQLWRCNRCDEGGDAIAFVMKYHNVKFVQALNIIRKSPNNLNVAVRHTVFADNVDAKKPKFASPENIDAAYRKLLSLLTLNSVDRQDLKRRGLTNQAIEKFGFKSLPKKGDRREICAAILNSGISLNGVPGFYRNTNHKYNKASGWCLNTYPGGYLIPYVNQDNQITGFQVRVRDLEADKNFGKYMMYTSAGKPYGVPSKLEPHLVGYTGQKEVYLTEGALKADIAHYFTCLDNHKKFAFLAIPGVNHTSMIREVFPKLKKMGVTTVYDCFDMDKVGNDEVECNLYVRKAIGKIRELAFENGLWWKPLTWNNGKGIDDHLLLRTQSRKKIKSS